MPLFSNNLPTPVSSFEGKGLSSFAGRAQVAVDSGLSSSVKEWSRILPRPGLYGYFAGQQTQALECVVDEASVVSVVEKLVQFLF